MPRAMSDHVCPHCGSSFRAPHNQIYCSNTCHYEHVALSAETRFWVNVDKTSSDRGCWLWIASTNPGGYGQFFAYKQHTLCHRFSWELHYGEIPGDLNVLHSCDVRNCCNPEHLFLGTAQDNADDARNKGRIPVGQRHAEQHDYQLVVGENNPNAKLTRVQVDELRAAYQGDARINRHARRRGEPTKPTLKELAACYGITFGQVARILKGGSW